MNHAPRPSRAVQALIAVCLCAISIPLLLEHAPTTPPGSKPEGTARPCDGPDRRTNLAIAGPVAVILEEPIGDAETVEDDSEVSSTVNAGNLPALGLCTVDLPPCPSAPLPPSYATLRPLHLRCHRLNC